VCVFYMCVGVCVCVGVYCVGCMCVWVCACVSQLWGMAKIPASAVNYELLAKFSSVSFPR
jgi:hypothetical protein